MTKKKRGLGALGVDVLLSTPGPETKEDGHGAALQQVPIERVHRSPYQPRQSMQPEALEALAESIRQQGMVQPVVVRRVAEDYQLIAGERRWRAAQIVGLQEIPAIVREASDPEAAALALVENLQREDLNALEEAQAFSALVEHFGLTHQQVGEATGRSRTAVSNSLRLLTLPVTVKDLLGQGRIEMGHARALLALDEAGQLEAAQAVVRQNLSVRATERLVKRMGQGTVRPSGRKTRTDPDILRMEEKLSGQLQARVKIRHRQNGSGQVSISYANLDEFGGLVERLVAPRD